MDKEAQTKFTKARAGLVLDQPFFASIALRLEVKEDSTCPTAWTDGKTLAYNPAWINSLTLDQTKGLICHEVMHVALLHNLRRNDRDPENWNIAGDYAINPILDDAKITLPSGGLLDRSLGSFAEEIYNKLPKPQKGEGNDPGKCGEVRDYPSPSGKPKATPSENAQQEQQQKIDTQQALTAAKRAGTLPASLEKLIDDLLEPVIPWKEVLARFIDSHSNNDYTWTKPNKRYLPQGLYLPALEAPELGHIGIFDDTSGSHFSREQQQKALSEIRGILESYQGVKATLIFVDTEVKGDPVELDNDIEINIPKPRGGGGTSFRPPFEYAEEHGIDFRAAIYITDGECYSFPEQPDYDTLWLLTERNESFNPPFGEVIHMENRE